MTELRWPKPVPVSPNAPDDPLCQCRWENFERQHTHSACPLHGDKR